MLVIDIIRHELAVVLDCVFCDDISKSQGSTKKLYSLGGHDH
jgi:hypothetical protein